MPVTDSEVLSKLVDATVLVISSGKTEIEMMQKAAEMLNNDKKNFIGTVLNNFSYKNGQKKKKIKEKS